jgi:hypothetical protein
VEVIERCVDVVEEREKVEDVGLERVSGGVGPEGRRAEPWMHR